MLLMRGPGGFTGGKVFDSMVTPSRPLSDDLRRRRDDAPGVAAGHVAAATGPRRDRRAHTTQIFAEMTFHAAYEPQRAVRTERWKYIRRFDDYPHPVLANCDDSATKELLVEAGWARSDRAPRSSSTTSFSTPTRPNDLSAIQRATGSLPRCATARATGWRRPTTRLLDGPIEPPAGAVVNDPSQRSPDDPLKIPEADAARR